MSEVTRSKFSFQRKIALAAAAAIYVAATSMQSVCAQDIIRPSLTRENAPDNRTFIDDEPNYNAQLGPVSFLLDASLFAEYNDNVNLSEVNPQSDVIIRPTIGVTAKWDLSEATSLSLRVGFGYSFYLNDSVSSGSAFSLDQGSEIAFNIFIGDFRIKIYDSFSLTDSPVDSVGFSEVENFGQFSNTAGIAITWELSDFVTTIGFQRNDTFAVSGNFDYLDSATDQVYGNVYFAITPTWGVGIEGAISSTRYDQNVQNDAKGWHAGVFVEGTLSETFSFRAAVGYQVLSFDDPSGFSSVPGIVGSLGNDTEDFDGVYANFGFTHELNASITHELTIGRETTLGVNSNFIDLFYVRHTAKWEIIKDVELITRLFYEEGNESGVFNSEEATRYGASIGASYQFAPTWILSAQYSFIRKDSNLDLRDYEQNRILLGVTYQF